MNIKDWLNTQIHIYELSKFMECYDNFKVLYRFFNKRIHLNDARAVANAINTPYYYTDRENDELPVECYFMYKGYCFFSIHESVGE